MQNRAIIAAAVGVLGWFLPVAQATVTDFEYRIVGYIPSKSTHTLSFDYDLQQLTITDIIYDYELDFEDGYLQVGTVFDSYPTTFNVAWDIVNNTGVTWTACEFIWGSFGRYPLGELVPESVESTKLQTVLMGDVLAGDLSVKLSGSPVVLDGETLTIEFTMVAHREFNVNHFRLHIIPEPATIMLLGLGGLILLRDLRAINRRHKG